ncbi:hypothetical protein JZ751_011498 [Albula glossodonta]|uniref:Glycosyl hydrolase family 31 C-terminal domain-containing protein n=1 Tax=Albula glossodonta TaxID=121402 RepID=A0A8T2N219_9TELE|nr:hypothetical protein JZ751_011498 [Albula glossodonta]
MIDPRLPDASGIPKEHDSAGRRVARLHEPLPGIGGVAVQVDPDVPLQVGIDSRTQFCLRVAPGLDLQPLRYTACVGRDLKAVHQEMGHQLHSHKRVLPNLNILRLPFWKFLAKVDSGAKVERELRTFSNRLRRHQLGEGDHEFVSGRRRTSKRQTKALPLVKLLNTSITLSPYLSIDSRQFQMSLQDGTEAYWLSVPTAPHGRLVPVLMQWKGNFCVKLNITNPAAVNWFLDKVGGLQAHLEMEYVTLEGGEGNPFEEQALRLPRAVAGDRYIGLLAGFQRCSPIHSHDPITLLGYSFFIPDAVGGSLTNEFVTDEELFIRWLEIVSFLPVITFQTPPWVCGEDRVLNLTRFYISKHQEFVVPLIVKYASEWLADGSPIYRPLWWISPDDPITYTIDDEFLIGDEVLVAPVTEQGAVQRDIYLPGSDFQWQDTSNAQVFDGGTLLENYPVGLEEVAVFTRRNSGSLVG